MFLLSTWLCFVLFAVCDAAAPTKDKFGNNVTNWNDVTGKAMGEFQFLGGIYPDYDPSATVNGKFITNETVANLVVLTKEEAPDTLKILLFDNNKTSFDMINRGIFGDSCSGNQLLSMGMTPCLPDCGYTMQVNAMSRAVFGDGENPFCPGCNLYEQKIKFANMEKHHALYFVAANCGAGPVQIEKYYISLSNPGTTAAPVPPPAAVAANKYAIHGTATGTFDLLGSMCVFPGQQLFGGGGSVMTVTLDYDNETPSHDEEVYLLAYDDKAMISLFDHAVSSYELNENECRRRRGLASHSVKLRAGSNSVTFTINSSNLSYGVEHDARRVSFVVMQCTRSSQLKVTNIKLHSDEGTDCARKCPVFADCKDSTVAVKGRRLRTSE